MGLVAFGLSSELRDGSQLHKADEPTLGRTVPGTAMRKRVVMDCAGYVFLDWCCARLSGTHKTFWLKFALYLICKLHIIRHPATSFNSTDGLAHRRRLFALARGLIAFGLVLRATRRLAVS